MIASVTDEEDSDLCLLREVLNAWVLYRTIGILNQMVRVRFIQHGFELGTFFYAFIVKILFLRGRKIASVRPFIKINKVRNFHFQYSPHIQERRHNGYFEPVLH